MQEPQPKIDVPRAVQLDMANLACSTNSSRPSARWYRHVVIHGRPRPDPTTESAMSATPRLSAFSYPRKISAAPADERCRPFATREPTYPQMPQLPRARADEHDDLRNAIPHRTGVGRFAEVAEIRLALALVLLLAADVLELQVEVAQLRGELRNV